MITKSLIYDIIILGDIVKKIILAVIFLLIVVVSSSCGMNKDLIRSGNGDLVIEFTSSPVFSSGEDNNENFIRLYDDKTISEGTNDKMHLKQDVSEEEYQKIINYAFSNSFVNLKEDLSDKSIMDGSCQYITLYFEDGTSKKYGGLNPTNKKFQKLHEMLIDALKMEEE